MVAPNGRQTVSWIKMTQKLLSENLYEIKYIWKQFYTAREAKAKARFEIWNRYEIKLYF